MVGVGSVKNMPKQNNNQNKWEDSFEDLFIPENKTGDISITDSTQ